MYDMLISADCKLATDMQKLYDVELQEKACGGRDLSWNCVLTLGWSRLGHLLKAVEIVQDSNSSTSMRQPWAVAAP